MVGGVYKGDMKIVKIHGEGTWTANGDSFVGAFKNGKMVCVGADGWTLANGISYFERALKNSRHLR
jgi:hypothetical protein